MRVSGLLLSCGGGVERVGHGEADGCVVKVVDEDVQVCVCVH